jgi:hypothetical protein
MILIVKDHVLHNATLNSTAKIFSTLNNYRNDVIIYDYINNKNLEEIVLNIQNIVKENNIKLIFFVATYFKQWPDYITNYLDISQYIKDIPILYHFHDYFVNATEKSLKCVKNCVELNIKENVNQIMGSVPNIYIILHCATKNFVDINFNPTPVNKILLSGCVNNVYPERIIFYKFYERNRHKVDYYKHPGYNNSNYTEDIYPNMLNKYICCYTSNIIKIGGKSKTYIIFAKVFEIMSVGSLLLIDNQFYNELNKIGIIDGVNCIMCSTYNIEDKVNFILDQKNKNLVDEIRMNGYNFIRNGHTYEHRLKEIDFMFNDIINRGVE